MSEQTNPSRRSAERLSPRIAEELRGLVVSGELTGGTKLRTEHLAARFGVSATPIREALMTLHGEGLVTFEPGRGFTVVPITRQDLLDLYNAQAHLAGQLCARAVGRFSDDDLRTLWRLQDELIGAIEAKDPAADRIEFEFHHVINHVADAPKLRWLLKMTTSHIPFQSWHVVPGWAPAAPEDHLPILRALSTKNADAAQMSMTAHIMNVGDLLAGLLAERGVLSDPAESGETTPKDVGTA
ncbi:GntR family transcriptional regulator [Gordonia rubripertincta]|uniref:GntR family transcriptional regulator n=1 Tax=Gordonia rubripertincta TaxID=36822 RepID=A0AAW4G3C2_GORRU|nr:GntR family transcriptional regulator [Gordonia rubripertincta]MBM7278012.1 GntR family transcriptional regulator [Gordonia rubripertincta]QMU22477.1 GntR family transcriptional regulator [Gordonia rubripertincta]